MSHPREFDELAPMASGAIFALLSGEGVTSAEVGVELERIQATTNGIAYTFAVTAAAMLIDACGGRAQARAFAGKWTRITAVRETRRLLAG